jgi:hypothetical protein
MKRRFIAGAVLVVAFALMAVGCRQEPTAVCAGLGYIKRPPADTTVVLGASIVLAAAEGQGCAGDPTITLAFPLYWKAADSTIVSIGVLDSIHVRVTGRAVGTTAVMTSASPAFSSTWSATQVTVR